VDFSHLKQWINRTESASDVASAAPLTALAAMLDHSGTPWPAATVPPLGHWLYLLPQARQSEIGEDGHPHRGGFLPPVELPRRMWAGSALTFHAPIRIGDKVTRDSTISAVEHKSGNTGNLVFVKVTHEWSTPSGPVITEIQDIVYREAAKSEPPAAAPKPEPQFLRHADWAREINPDPVLLFRFSALTFNGHRIHYDRAYCTDVEGYPGLVVHGPLTATLLMDLFLRNNPGAQVGAFTFRGRRPLFDTEPFTLYGSARTGGADLWAINGKGNVAMTAELELR
jgi:3-methylfumaryl-CoA hydratase